MRRSVSSYCHHDDGRSARRRPQPQHQHPFYSTALAGMLLLTGMRKSSHVSSVAQGFVSPGSTCRSPSKMTQRNHQAPCRSYSYRRRDYSKSPCSLFAHDGCRREFDGVGVTSAGEMRSRHLGRHAKATKLSMSLLSRIRGRTGPSGSYEGADDGNSPSPIEPRNNKKGGSTRAQENAVAVLDSDQVANVSGSSAAPGATDVQVRRESSEVDDFHEETGTRGESSLDGGDAAVESDARDTPDEGKGHEEEEEDTKRRGLFTYDWENGKRVKWVANKRSRVNVVQEEGRRKLQDYLALPPTEYSLLDPKMITRLSEDEFRMDGGTLNIVGTKVIPTLFVRVDVQPEESLANIMVERVELSGSDAVKSASGTFNVTSSTVVSSAELENGKDNELELNTRAHIEIEMLVPNENFVPVGVLRRAGNFVMQRVLDVGLPQFTKFLKRDYERWSEGNDDRAAVATDGESLVAAEE